MFALFYETREWMLAAFCCLFCLAALDEAMAAAGEPLPLKNDSGAVVSGLYAQEAGEEPRKIGENLVDGDTIAVPAGAFVGNGRILATIAIDNDDAVLVLQFFLPPDLGAVDAVRLDGFRGEDEDDYGSLVLRLSGGFGERAVFPGLPFAELRRLIGAGMDTVVYADLMTPLEKEVGVQSFRYCVALGEGSWFRAKPTQFAAEPGTATLLLSELYLGKYFSKKSVREFLGDFDRAETEPLRIAVESPEGDAVLFDAETMDGIGRDATWNAFARELEAAVEKSAAGGQTLVRAHVGDGAAMYELVVDFRLRSLEINIAHEVR